MRGRKPKPSYMRVLDGNAGRRPLNKEEPQPDGRLEDMGAPARLSVEQRDIWNEAMRECPDGLLRRLDFGIFEQWVVHCHTFRKAAEMVAAKGSIVMSKEGTPYQNPFLSVMNKQSSLMMKAAAEMGFSPSSRTRVKVSRKNTAKSSTFSDLKRLED